MLRPLPGLPIRVPRSIVHEGAQEAPGHDPHTDTGATSIHVAPLSGWGSDPHGVVFFKGRYHLFHQERPGTCQWYWGQRWAHLASSDLISWVRLPPALLPTPGGLDADGVFTGNIQVHPETGVPMLFYTGARLRHNPVLRHPDPPSEACNPLMFHWETQLCAMADPDDELLVRWHKVAAPWMEFPHCAYLSAWRDPFFVPPALNPRTGLPDNQPAQGQDEAAAQGKQPDAGLPGIQGTPPDFFPAVTQPAADGSGEEHMMLIGSGLEGLGGTALVYRSKDLASGWRFAGYLCTWPNLDTGLCWECPHLLHMPELPPGLDCCVSHMSSEWRAHAARPTPKEEQDRLVQQAHKVWMDMGLSTEEAWRAVDITQCEDLFLRDVPPVKAAALQPVPEEIAELTLGMVETTLADVLAPVSRGSTCLSLNPCDTPSTSIGSGSSSAPGSVSAHSDTLDQPPVGEQVTLPAVADGDAETVGLSDSENLLNSNVVSSLNQLLTGELSNSTGEQLVVPRSTSLHLAFAASRPNSNRFAEETLAAQMTESHAAGTRCAVLASRVSGPGDQAATVLSATTAEQLTLDTGSLLDPGSTGAASNEAIAAQAVLLTAILEGRQQGAAALAAEAQQPALQPPPPLELLPGHNSLLDSRVASVCDIKAATEASLSGMGVLAVLSHNAPYETTNASAPSVMSLESAQPPRPAGDQAGKAGKSVTMPSPPVFTEGSASKEEIRAACRKYAEAAAAVQGHDLNMPAVDSDVVRRCKEGPPAVPAPAPAHQRWFLGFAPDAATYSILYFIGDYKDNRFDLETAQGPYKLDMGNTLYAPLAFYDQKHGRHIIWGYLKELRELPPPPSMCNKYTSSGCVSLPRAVYLKEGRLFQVPIPELAKLRSGEMWVRDDIEVGGEHVVVPGHVAGDHFDMEITARKGSAEALVLLLPSWRDEEQGSAAITFNWKTGRLQVVFSPCASLAADSLHIKEGGLHVVKHAPDTEFHVFVDPKVPPVPDLNPDVPDWIRMKPADAGGVLCMDPAQDALRLRVFMDASALEIFTGTGEALSTRVYRGSQPAAASSGLHLVSVGGVTHVEHVEVHATSSAWLREEDAPLPPPVSAELLKRWSRHMV